MSAKKDILKAKNPKFYNWYTRHFRPSIRKEIEDVLAELKPLVETFEDGGRDEPIVSRIAELGCRLYRLQRSIEDPEGIFKARERQDADRRHQHVIDVYNSIKHKYATLPSISAMIGHVYDAIENPPSKDTIKRAISGRVITDFPHLKK